MFSLKHLLYVLQQGILCDILLRGELELKHLLSHQVMPDLTNLCLVVRICIVSQDIVIREESKVLNFVFVMQISVLVWDTPGLYADIN